MTDQSPETGALVRWVTEGETVFIGEDISIKVYDVREKRNKIRIVAPRSLNIVIRQLGSKLSDKPEAP